MELSNALSIEQIFKVLLDVVALVISWTGCGRLLPHSAHSNIY